MNYASLVNTAYASNTLDARIRPTILLCVRGKTARLRVPERCDYGIGSRNSIADWRSELNETETPFFIRFFPVILVLVPRSTSRT
jgi:hypothetical protein